MNDHAERTSPRGGRAWLQLGLRLTLHAAVNPRLAIDLLRTVWAFRARDWYRRPPFIPWPPREYLRWRMHTAYGDDEAIPPLVVPVSLEQAVRIDGLTEGPVVIKLISQGGGIYLYDVKIESGATVVVNPRTRGNRMPLSKKDGLKVSNRAGIEMFTLAGQKVIFPGAQSIPHALCSKGTYVIRIPGSKKEVTSINVSR